MKMKSDEDLVQEAQLRVRLYCPVMCEAVQRPTLHCEPALQRRQESIRK